MESHRSLAKLLEDNRLTEAKPAATPFETSFLSSETTKSEARKLLFTENLQDLLYLATVSRPDIATAVVVLSRRVENPTEHWNAVKSVLRYLKSTINNGLSAFIQKFTNKMLCRC